MRAMRRRTPTWRNPAARCRARVGDDRCPAEHAFLAVEAEEGEDWMWVKSRATHAAHTRPTLLDLAVDVAAVSAGKWRHTCSVTGSPRVLNAAA